MAATEKKIADLVAFTTPADGDLLPVVDVSDTAQSDDGSTKKITRANFLGTLFSIAADTGTDLVVLPAETFSILGGTGIASVASATRKITLNIDATVATLTGTQVFTNKTFGASTLSGDMNFATYSALNMYATSPVFVTPQLNDTSEDHQYITAVSELTADRTVTMPLLLANDTFVFANHIQTLVGKTLTSPVLVTPKADTLDENTGDAGVTVEGVLMKDSEINVDTIDEKTAEAGVTIERVRMGNGDVVIPGVGSFKGTTTALADDGATSFTPNNTLGVILIYGRAVGYSAEFGIVSWRVESTNFAQIIVGGTDLEVSTSALTGTTGTDGKLTVSADHTTGKIYIENRMGASRSYGYVLFGT